MKEMASTAKEPGNSAGAAEASQPTSPVDEAVANTDANRSPCSNARLEQEASISKSPAEEEAPDAESGSAAPEDAIAAAAAPLRRPRRGPSTKLAIILISVVLLAIAAELWIMSMPQVPLLIDKLYFGVALAFQLMMVLASLPLPEQGLCCIRGETLRRIRSLLLDVAHWAFVVMSFGGAIVLRAPESLAFTAAIAAAALAFRLSMRNRCIITSVARGSSLPRISGKTVTNFFLTLLVVTVIRLLLQLIFGRGFPWDQAIAAISGHHPSAMVAQAVPHQEHTELHIHV